MKTNETGIGRSGRKLLAPLLLLAGSCCIVAAGMVVAQEQADAPDAKLVARGKMLVDFGDCNTCHTPWTMTPNGPRPDSTKYLSGHPAGMIAPAPKLEMPWMAAGNATLTAWAGPWGISYSTNLTPDSSGMGVWTEDMFVQAMRTGKHWGVSRPIMPPMPWESIATLSDDDLKAMYAYLRTIPPIHNVVPDYEPPTGK